MANRHIITSYFILLNDHIALLSDDCFDKQIRNQSGLLIPFTNLVEFSSSHSVWYFVFDLHFSFSL